MQLVTNTSNKLLQQKQSTTQNDDIARAQRNSSIKFNYNQ